MSHLTRAGSDYTEMLTRTRETDIVPHSVGIARMLYDVCVVPILPEFSCEGVRFLPRPADIWRELRESWGGLLITPVCVC